MHIVQLFFPKAGLPAEALRRTKDALVEMFDEVTVYSQRLARRSRRDGDVIVYEVLVPRFDRHWWREYRATLAARLRRPPVQMRAYLAELH